MAPANRNSSIPKKAVSTRQREIHQGASPAIDPGAMTRKIAEPTIAGIFLVMLNRTDSQAHHDQTSIKYLSDQILLWSAER
jgi:hypothetical protein